METGHDADDEDGDGADIDDDDDDDDDDDAKNDTGMTRKRASVQSSAVRASTPKSSEGTKGSPWLMMADADD